MKTLLFLILAFQIKHFICDFPLQGRWMLGKFKNWPEFILPLASHSAVHAIGSAVIALVFAPRFVFVWSLFDFITHFVIDRIKASPKLGGRWKPQDAKFWIALGADQLAHNIVYISMVWMLIM